MPYGPQLPCPLACLPVCLPVFLPACLPVCLPACYTEARQTSFRRRRPPTPSPGAWLPAVHVVWTPAGVCVCVRSAACLSVGQSARSTYKGTVPNWPPALLSPPPVCQPSTTPPVCLLACPTSRQPTRAAASSLPSLSSPPLPRIGCPQALLRSPPRVSRRPSAAAPRPP